MKKLLKLSIFVMLTGLSSYATEPVPYTIENKSTRPISADFNERILIKFNSKDMPSEDGDKRDFCLLVKYSLHRRDHPGTKKIIDFEISRKKEGSNDVWRQDFNLKKLELLPDNFYKNGYKGNFEEELDDGSINYLMEIDPRYNLIFAAMFYEKTFSDLVSDLRRLIQDVRDGNKITGLSLITIDVTREYLLKYIDNILEPELKRNSHEFITLRESVEALTFGASEVLSMSDENLDRLILANEEKVIECLQERYTYSNYSYREKFFRKSSFFDGIKAKIFTFDSYATRGHIINLVLTELNAEELELLSENLGVAIESGSHKKYFVPWKIFGGKLSIDRSDFQALKGSKNFFNVASEVTELILRYSITEIDEALILTWLSPDLSNLKKIQIAGAQEHDDFLTINSRENNCTLTLVNGFRVKFNPAIIGLINSKKNIKEINIADTSNIGIIAQIGAPLLCVTKLKICGGKADEKAYVLELQPEYFIVVINFLFPNLEYLIFHDLNFTKNKKECHFTIGNEQLKNLKKLEFHNISNEEIFLKSSFWAQFAFVHNHKKLWLNWIEWENSEPILY